MQSGQGVGGVGAQRHRQRVAGGGRGGDEPDGLGEVRGGGAQVTGVQALAALTDEGALGVKSGRGLLGRYDEGQVREVIEWRARALLMLDSLSR